MSAKRQTWLKILGTGLLLGVMVWLIQKSGAELSWSEIGRSAGRIGFKTGLMALFWVLIQTLCQIVRLWYLLPSNGLTLQGVARAFSVGQFFNSFVPARAGDVVKVLMLSNSGGPAPAQGAGVMVADKVLDLLSLFAVVVLTGALTFVPGNFFNDRGGAIAVPLVVGIALLTTLYILRRSFGDRFPTLIRFESGIQCLFKPRRSLLGLLWSAGSWLVEACALICLADRLGLSMSLSQAVYCLFLLNIAIAVPVSVGNVGTFEASLAFGFTGFGLGLSEAVAVAGIHHVIQWVGISIWAGGTSVITRCLRNASPLSKSPPSA